MPEILHPREGGGIYGGMEGVVFGYTGLGLLRVALCGQSVGRLSALGGGQYLPLTRNGTKRVVDRQRGIHHHINM